MFGLAATASTELVTTEPAELIQLRERVRYLEQQATDLRAQLDKAEAREAKPVLRMPVPWWRRLVGPKD